MENLVYEFTEDQNKVIKRLRANMLFVGIFILLLGAFLGIGDLIYCFAAPKVSIIKFIFLAVVAIVTIMMGIFTFASSKSFMMVFKTEGNDIEHLMKAIDKLATWFGILTFAIIVALAIVVLGALAAIL
jgi:hypothetical protein